MIQQFAYTSAIAATQRDFLAVDQMHDAFTTRSAPQLLDVAQIHYGGTMNAQKLLRIEAPLN